MGNFEFDKVLNSKFNLLEEKKRNKQIVIESYKSKKLWDFIIALAIFITSFTLSQTVPFPGTLVFSMTNGFT